MLFHFFFAVTVAALLLAGCGETPKESFYTLSADVLPHLPEKEAVDVRERMTPQWVTFFSWNLSDLKLND